MAITTLGEGRYVEVNDAFIQQVGHTRREMIGRTSLELAVWPTPRDRAAMMAALRAGQTIRSRKTIFRTKGGGLITTAYSAVVIDFDGQSCVLASIEDITAQILAEEALRESQQEAIERTAFLQALVQNSPFAIVVGGPDHKIRFCNAAFERIFRYSADEVIGKDPDDLIGLPDSSEAADFSRQVMSGRTVRATAIRRRKDGSTLHVEFHAVPLFSDGAFVGCFGIYQDITERVTSEASLKALRRRLTLVQEEERAHLARELHDDISQRLALVALQLAQLTSRNSAKALREPMSATKKLVDEILGDLHRLARRIHPSQLQHITLTTALKSLSDEFTRRSGITVELSHDKVTDHLPVDIKICLYRVAQEAIRNAEQHSGADTVQVTLSAGPDDIRCRISDAGRGFTVGSAGAGRGLGLVSMTERVHSMGGTLSIHSESGRGTRIDVSIPLPRAAARGGPAAIEFPSPGGTQLVQRNPGRHGKVQRINAVAGGDSHATVGGRLHRGRQAGALGADDQRKPAAARPLGKRRQRF
jgi:PAS domain S-box-containing protein